MKSDLVLSPEAPLLLLRRVLFTVARRAAADPRVRAKARQVFDEHARPAVEKTANEVRRAAARKPGEHPARAAGRVLKRLLDG